jgi:hypothetical protein
MTFVFVLPTFLSVVGFGTPEPLALAPMVEVIIVPVAPEDRSIADAKGVVAATGILPGVIVFELAFAEVAVAAAAAAAVLMAAAALLFRGGVVEVCNIIALLGESWVR